MFYSQYICAFLTCTDVQSVSDNINYVCFSFFKLKHYRLFTSFNCKCKILVLNEQSIEQIANRADRMHITTENLYLYSSTDIQVHICMILFHFLNPTAWVS